MTKFKLEITLGNDSMITNDDIARSLIKVSKQLELWYDPKEQYRILDDNGNTVGKWSIK